MLVTAMITLPSKHAGLTLPCDSVFTDTIYSFLHFEHIRCFFPA